MRKQYLYKCDIANPDKINQLKIATKVWAPLKMTIDKIAFQNKYSPNAGSNKFKSLQKNLLLIKSFYSLLSVIQLIFPS